MAADYAGNEELALLSPSVITIFLVCGKLVDHLPVCSWIRMATEYMKRRGNIVTTGWDDETNDDPLKSLLVETLLRVQRNIR